MLKIQSLRKLKKFQFIKKLFLDFNIPTHISKNFITVTDIESKFNEKKINYLNLHKEDNSVLEFTSEEEFRLVNERIDGHRKQIIPWLDSVRRLKGLRILEIGCGKGCSTVAFAEQGAIVTAIDVNESYLLDAKVRCELYGLDVNFHLMNASEVNHFFKDEIFDVVIFMASLEHMTIDERIQSMKSTYELLPKGGLWCIVGTPNRLHFLDSHTSHIPFFHWLPDQIALKYSQFSSRDEYKENILDIDDEQEKLLQFYRWGRGVSFHEIELAIKPMNKLKIISNKAQFLRKKNWLYYIGSKFTPNYKYEIFLRKLYPDIHSCFFQPYLDLIIEKE
jgi:S-adenosylmethionine-dependent methyltransferase